jgi:hypothetical protein
VVKTFCQEAVLKLPSSQKVIAGNLFSGSATYLVAETSAPKSAASLLSAPGAVIQLSAFGFGMLGVGLTYSISRVYRTTPLVMLVLGGVVVAASSALSWQT